MSSKITPDSKWIENFRKSIRKFVLRGDYQSALQISKQALKSYPDSFDCRFQYAKILGDWADELPPALKKKYKKEAISILRPLTRAKRRAQRILRPGIRRMPSCKRAL